VQASQTDGRNAGVADDRGQLLREAFAQPAGGQGNGRRIITASHFPYQQPPERLLPHLSTIGFRSARIERIEIAIVHLVDEGAPEVLDAV
jgi:hypothetical protein